ncbi:type II/IV secretion system ATPase subunit [Salinibaculum rarum]|uniref:type II/IV secretion system ATPase subunit n=1 Tax=Salinibaculum rarum TaxID=3058903 RepID=UPI00265F2085|nr:ATPase, T2SS/T4P/T4SS family [Salinibaculum sp. KK48]
MSDGADTLVGHSDLENAVPSGEKPFLEELERYWVNKPYAYIVIYRNTRDQELRYYAVEPKLSDTERELVEFFSDKLRLSINYDKVGADATPNDRAEVVRNETIQLMKRYNLISQDTFNPENAGIRDRVKEYIASILEERADQQAMESEESVDPIPAPRDEETGELEKLDDRQVQKILYYLVRDFIRYGTIDPIKHDINIEDISCDGYNQPVFVYHTQYEQIITNIEFAEEDLDEFVTKLAQNAGKGISKRQPNVDATLADGSRAQLTLGTEVSDKGTNFTIRQFKDVPFTPVDLINWQTFSLDQMVYMWLCIENNKSVIFAGGTASGKTTSLNAVSLFIPSKAKIVSIEDTRELEIPQKNWVPSKTRESFQEGEQGSIDEFDLLEDALRQRPDYIIMGEVRGEEGRTLFQAMNTGHTTYTTFHADSAREVIRRFTTDPINVAESLFGALDAISIQASVDIDGRRVRRTQSVVEIDEYNAKNDDYTVEEVYSWEAESDEFRENAENSSDLMDEIMRERGWSDADFHAEWQRRRIVLAYLIREGLNTYAGVAATLQAYMNNPETILALIGDNELKHRIDNLRSMQNVDINVNPEKEELVPRPDPSAEVREQCERVIEDAQDLLNEFNASSVDLAEELSEGLADEFDEIDTGPSEPVNEQPTDSTDDEPVLEPQLEPGDDDDDDDDDDFEESMKDVFDENEKAIRDVFAEDDDLSSTENHDEESITSSSDQGADDDGDVEEGEDENTGVEDSISNAKAGNDKDDSTDELVDGDEDEESAVDAVHETEDGDGPENGEEAADDSSEPSQEGEGTDNPDAEETETEENADDDSGFSIFG